jgi:hypothetical protein
MFKSPESRYVLRASLVGLLAGLSSLAASTFGSDLQLGEVFLALSTALGGALAYAGIGAASPHVEPSIGNKP